jgi:phage terminase large subunit-like protein
MNRLQKSTALRQTASRLRIVFDVAHQMVSMTPALLKRSKIMAATKRIVNYSNAGFYQVLSAEVGTKHGLNVSGLVFDEVHAQPTRKLYDVLTQGSGDAREQPLFFLITTAGTDKNSICYELHQKAKDILSGQRVDHTFYPVVYGLEEGEDWHDEKTGTKRIRASDRQSTSTVSGSTTMRRWKIPQRKRCSSS